MRLKSPKKVIVLPCAKYRKAKAEQELLLPLSTLNQIVVSFELRFGRARSYIGELGKIFPDVGDHLNSSHL